MKRKLIQQKRCLRRHFDFPEIDFNGLKMSQYLIPVKPRLTGLGPPILLISAGALVFRGSGSLTRPSPRKEIEDQIESKAQFTRGFLTF